MNEDWMKRDPYEEGNQENNTGSDQESISPEQDSEQPEVIQREETSQVLKEDEPERIQKIPREDIPQMQPMDTVNVEEATASEGIEEQSSYEASEAVMEPSYESKETPESMEDNREDNVTYSWVNPKLQGDTGAAGENTSFQREQQESPYDAYRFASEEPDHEPKYNPIPQEKKGGSPTARKFGLTIALAAVFGVVSGAVFLGVTSLGGGERTEEIQQIEETVPAGNDGADSVTDQGGEASSDDTAAVNTSTNTVAGVAANSMPSVVAISNIGIQEVENFFGGIQSYESESSGSGIIVGQNDSELLIATNNHVITGANTITVTFIDETSVEAQVKGADASNDLAVVAVALTDMEQDTLSQIKVATLGNSDDLVVGEQVVAIGNALGYGQSVTSGYVSALNREVTVDDVTAHLIQTDAAINPGNSGGALLNMRGELIGINAVKFASSEVEGMGYAIPVSTAEPILDDLMNRETRSRVSDDQASYLGITCRDVTAETQQMYNLPSGVFVDSVSEGSASEKAGMIKGDIITKFDGAAISSYEELVRTLQYYPAGETVEIVVMRAERGEYNEVSLAVTLDARPQN